MYSLLSGAHSHTRWLVLVAAAFALLIPLINGKEGNIKRIPALVFLIICDIQLLLGLSLYFGESPFGLKAFENGMSYVMKTGDVRKIAVEHLVLMLTAISLVHIGYAKIKRAENAASAKKTSLIFFGIALLLILAGIPWARL